MKFKGICFVLCAVLLPRLVMAQRAPAQGPGEIRGVVVDAGGQPIRFATIEIRKATDNALVTGTLTSPSGDFRIAGLAPGRYNVRVSSIGYAATSRADVTLSQNALTLQLGRIQLADAAVSIDSLTVTGLRREVRLSPEKNSYVVKDMPATTGGSAIDVLKNVPSVEVDGDDNLSLRGNQNVVVQLNGRAVPMTGLELGAFLAQLPANMLDKVEVVPNPSAKYDPEGMAGIINIVLKQDAELGMSGGLSLTGGTTEQLNTSGNLGYQHGALTLLGNYGFLDDERKIWGFSDLTIGSDPATRKFQNQSVDGERNRRSHTFNSSAEYRLSKLSSLTSNLILSHRTIGLNNDILIRKLDANQVVTGLSDQLLTATSSSTNIDYALGFTHKAGDLNEFTTEARVFRGRNTDNNLFATQLLTTQGTAANNTPDLMTNVPATLEQEWTLQSDLTRGIGKNGKLETGYKGALNKLNSDLTVANFSYSQDHYIPDANRTNTFAYDEQIHAVYGVYSQTVGKWDLQGGLRMEAVSTHFNLKTTAENFDRRYHSLFPSAVAAYDFDDDHQLKLIYSKRIRRPDTDHMNPFTEYEDALDVSRGNPALKPEYTHSYQIGYQSSGPHGSVQVTPFYRHSVNSERRIREIDPTGLTTTTFTNVASSNSYGSELIGSYKSSKVSGFAGFTAFKQVTDGSNLPTDFSNNAFGWSARVNATWTVAPHRDAQLLWQYRAPMTVEQGRVGSRAMLNVAVRQKLHDDHLVVSLRANDVFRQSGSAFTSTDPQLLQVTQRHQGARGLFLSLSYTFGQEPKFKEKPADQPVDTGGN